MFDYPNLKAEIIKKYLEHKKFLSTLDLWSYVINPTHFTFIVSQDFYKSLKFSDDIEIIEEKVISARMSCVVKIPEIKIEDFLIDKIELIQDIEHKSQYHKFFSSNFLITKDIQTRNIFRTKELNIFDLKFIENKLSFRIFINNSELICLFNDI